MPTPREVFERYLQCVLRKDWQAFSELFTDDAVLEVGRDDIHRTLAPLWRASAAAGLRVLGHEVLAAHSGDPSAVAVEFEVFGEDATGAAYRLRYVHALRIDRDGRIALLRDYVDARVLAERRAAVIAAASSRQSRA